MKKWLMLALLPLLLLLVQQEAEAGATALDPKTIQSTVPGDLGYTATFTEYDMTENGVYDYVDITILFGSSVDLSMAKRVEQDKEQPPPSSSDLAPNASNPNKSSLIGFVTEDDAGFISQIIVNLTVSGNPEVVTLGSLSAGLGGISFNLSNNTMTAYIDAQTDITGVNIGACSRMSLWGTSMSSCAPMTQAPVANSLLLMGIGLMALGIPLRRGRLS